MRAYLLWSKITLVEFLEILLGDWLPPIVSQEWSRGRLIDFLYNKGDLYSQLLKHFYLSIVDKLFSFSKYLIVIKPSKNRSK